MTTKDLKRLEEYLWNGIRTSREQVFTAHVVITGKDEPFAYEGQAIKQRPARDIRIEVFRDRTQECDKYIIRTGIGPQTRWIATPESVAQWIGLDASVVELIDSEIIRNKHCKRYELDVVALLPLGAQLEATERMDVVEVKDFIQTSLNSIAALDSIESRGSVHVLKYSRPFEATDGKYTDLFEIHVDEARSFAVTRMRHTVRLEYGSHKTVMQHDLSTTWELQKGLWLPVKFHSLEPMGGIKASLDIQWLKVNEPLDEDTFAVDNIGAPAARCTIPASTKSGIWRPV